MAKRKHNAGNAAKAYRLRKKEKAGEALDPVDKLWLVQYDEETAKHAEDRAARRKKFAKDIGASRSTRTLKVDLQEEQEAAGTGSAAAIAAAALEAKEEGRRLDHLTIGAVDALKEACHVYRSICLSLRQRTEILEATHVELLRAVHGAYTQNTSLEMELMRAREDGGTSGDPAQQLLAQLIAKRMGVTLPGVSPTGFPPTNGQGRKRGH